MSTEFARHLDKTTTPQSEQVAPKQVPNSAGGFTFAVDDWKRLDRFLILGSEGGTYYIGERKLTQENAAVVSRCVQADGLRVVRTIVDISDAGRAPKNDPALLALAIAMKHGDLATRQAARAALSKVARIPTHLFHLAEFIKIIGGGWGYGTKRAFAKWYTDASPDDKLALHVIKYQQRDGWSNRDVMRKSHPDPRKVDTTRGGIFRWAVKGWDGIGDDPHPDEVLARIWAFERSKRLTGASDVAELIRLIDAYRLPHECVPNEAKKHAAVWEALLPSMGLGAMVRNLGKMTAVGLLAPMSAASSFVAGKLGSVEDIRGARLHPLSILVALKTYAQGHGDKGSLRWDPNQQIVDALDGAFYTAFRTVDPTGKRHMLALDISGSMGASISGMPLTCREAATALALVTANVEPEYALYGFTAGIGPSMHGPPYGSGLTAIDISARSRLDDAIMKIAKMPMGGTDCALPMTYAAKHKLPVDVFCVYTDNETWAGGVHPHVALETYRQKMGRPAKLVVLGMVSNGFTIANPDDAGMLDVVGFDTAAPAVMADFAR